MQQPEEGVGEASRGGAHREVELDRAVPARPLLHRARRGGAASALVRTGPPRDGVALPRGVLVADGVGERPAECGERQTRLDGDVDQLAATGGAPGEVGEQRTGRGVGRRVRIRLRDADGHRRPVALPVRVERASGRPEHQVAVDVVGLGAGEPERRDGRVDQVRVRAQQPPVAEAAFGEPGGGERRHQDVGGGDQGFQRGDALRRVQVEGDTALVRGVGVPTASRAAGRR